MADSTTINIEDVRAITRLIGECRELGDDSLVWRQHFLASLGQLIGAELLLGGEVGGVLSGDLRIPGGTAWGFEHGFKLEGYLALGEIFAEGPMKSELFAAQVNGVIANQGQGSIYAREQVLSDREWDRAYDYRRISFSLGTDDCLHSLQPTERAADSFDSISICRAPGRRKFGEREVALVKLVHQEIARMVGGALAEYHEPSPSQLPPRVRQVLRCLLEGDGDKQIAARLELSPYTVNQYTKHIFQHFKVNSRPELLARWVRRAWGLRSNWDTAVDAPRFAVAG
jgi:DNA-binding CsgD family transcriptional regulator